MDETAARKKPGWSNKAAAIVAGGERTEDSVVGFGGEESVDDEACDGEAWNTLSRSFHQAQIVLDENRVLIQEVNNNHKSKIPDNMVKNVGLIRQINGNISKVLSIYSDLSTSFSNIVRQRAPRRRSPPLAEKVEPERKIVRRRRMSTCNRNRSNSSSLPSI